MDDISRRQWLKVVGVTGISAASVPLAGCSAPSDGGADGGSSPTSTPTEAAGGGGGNSGGNSGDFVETSTVDMTDELTFDPKQIQVSVGTTVTWENVGSIGHTITAYEDEIPDGAAYFASGGFDNEEAARDGYPQQGNVLGGESYEYTFETAGEYGYFCIPHELNGMVGTVKVI